MLIFILGVLAVLAVTLLVIFPQPIFWLLAKLFKLEEPAQNGQGPDSQPNGDSKV